MVICRKIYNNAQTCGFYSTLIKWQLRNVATENTATLFAFFRLNVYKKKNKAFSTNFWDKIVRIQGQMWLESIAPVEAKYWYVLFCTPSYLKTTSQVTQPSMCIVHYNVCVICNDVFMCTTRHTVLCCKFQSYML